MGRAVRHIPFDELANSLTDVFDRIVREHVSVVVEREGNPIAVVSPITPRTSKRGRHTKTAADHEAFLAAAGSWAKVDIDTFIQEIYEGRERSSRPPVDL
jgi:hypothetical protein